MEISKTTAGSFAISTALLADSLGLAPWLFKPDPRRWRADNAPPDNTLTICEARYQSDEWWDQRLDDWMAAWRADVRQWPRPVPDC